MAVVLPSILSNSVYSPLPHHASEPRSLEGAEDSGKLPLSWQYPELLLFHSHELSDNLKEWAMFADEPLQ
jgi:hypothetical protein